MKKGPIMVLLSRILPSVCFTSYHATIHAKYLIPNAFLEQTRHISRGGDSKDKLQATTTPTATEEEVESVAEQCKNICSSLEVSSFGGIPFISTDSIFPKHRVLFVLGGPGAGKGTQSAKIVDEYKSCHLSVGELLRTEGPLSPHKELIEECLVSGSIVPVEISLSLLRQAMDRESEESQYGDKIFLVDGFPRNFDNLQGWSYTMPPYTTLLGALIFDCPEQVLEQRILHRGKTSGRSDDNIASARKRFQTYETQTRSVIRALEKMQREDKLCQVHHIVGDKSIEEVWDQVKGIMNSFVKNDILTKTKKMIQAIENEDYKTYCELCHEDMLGENDQKTFFEENEKIENKTVILKNKNKISSIEFSVFDGTKAVISYDRIILGEDGEELLELRETRVWNHSSNGWRQVHFSREALN